ncbi:hypothetical protein TSUD_292540 [Trifolium subterraneum]|uniref:Uncharacterized protein n=1 Tax=Trifolium subterraneum TaxID=3900 RepID=A0A2Z6NQ64_TRISU|nr:hypothetical protein TSUD_292540 [Trifolium subterraneum]
MVGGISNRAFGSIFASDVPTSTVKEIKEMRAKKRCKPTMEHSQTLSCQMGLDSNVLNFDGASTSFSSYRGEERSNVLNFDCASNNEVEFNQMKFNLSNFLMADDMNLMNEMNVNHDASELKSYMFNFFQDVLPLEQLNKGCDDVSPSAEITTCVWNESPKSSSQNSNQLYNGDNNVVFPLTGITSCVLREPPSSNQISIQLQGNERFSNGEASNRFMEDNMSKASTSTATDPASLLEFDMDLIEAMFGTR